jgi:ketosteroid isomerase-like protein
MSYRKDVIERYIEGFRRGDHAQILGCLTDDIAWVLHGHQVVRGKAAFEAAIGTDFFEGTPTLEIHRMIEEGDAVAVFGAGRVVREGGVTATFTFGELFLFTGERVHRLETWHVWTAPLLAS